MNVKYKGRAIVISTVLIIHGFWIWYRFFLSSTPETMDIVLHGFSLTVELLVAYVFGKRLDRYRRLSEIDYLTKLYNRRYAFTSFSELVHHLDENEKIFVFVMDINDFKTINDTFGHDCGDDVLQAFSYYLQAAVTKEDVPARLGGDEFLVLHPHASDKTTEVISREVKHSLRHISNEVGLDISISIGKAVYPDDGDSLSELINQADKKMYTNKFLAKTEME